VATVDVVAADEITDSDAIAAGYPDTATLIADLRGAPGEPVYRITFRYLNEPDPRDVLAHSTDLTDEEVADITGRLTRLDGASSHGSWTRSYLEAIQNNPERRAPDLAALFGRETQPFKVDVRKLKNLGLTLSFRVGYRLSPRGEEYLDRVRAER
jgi:hypothetical protein